MGLKKTNWGTGFEPVPNALIEQGSFRATGLWAFLAKLPDGWDFSVRGVAAVRKEGLDAIRSAVQELEKLGYLRREQGRGDGGKMSSGNWLISRTPLQEKPTTAEPTTAEPTTAEPTTENPTQQHTQQTTDNTKNIPKELPPECYALASLLKENILRLYPNNVGAKHKDAEKRWAVDIDKAVRIDGRTYEELEAAVLWAFNKSDFWHKQIWSGANLRKHFDKMYAQAFTDRHSKSGLKQRVVDARKFTDEQIMEMDKRRKESYEQARQNLGN